MEPIFIRELTEEEYQQIQEGINSSDPFVSRRCQILAASARGEHAIPISRQIGCDDQTVRDLIKSFNIHGLSVLRARSSRPHRLRTVMDAEATAQLPGLLHRSPGDFGKEQGLWTLALLAEVCFEQGLTARMLSIEGTRKIIKRMGITWKQAKHWINAPDVLYQEENGVTV